MTQYGVMRWIRTGNVFSLSLIHICNTVYAHFIDLYGNEFVLVQIRP